MDLNQYLKKNKIGVYEFAKDIGISYALLFMIRKGKKKVPDYVAEKIENLTNGVVTKNDLVQNNTYMKKQKIKKEICRLIDKMEL